jgi:hypothetical protein
MRKSRVKQPIATGDATARYENNSHSGTTWNDLMPTPANGTDSILGVQSATITNITQANPGVVTTAAPHGFGNGTTLEITGVVGMTELNNKRWVSQGVTANTFNIWNIHGAAPVNTGGFNAYTSGGVAAVGPLNFPVFNGTTYIDFGQPAKLNLSSAFSVSIWGSQNADSSQGYERLLSRDHAPASLRTMILSQNDGTGKPYFSIFIGNSEKNITGTNNYADGNWHHYVGTHDGNTLKLYVDGVLEGEVPAVGTIDLDATDWQVGRAQHSSDFLEGRCNVLRYYNRALSADEILRDYHAGKPAHP